MVLQTIINIYSMQIKEEIPEKYRIQIESRPKFMFWRDDDWLIDKEKNIMFYSIGGNPRGSETAFEFLWKGEVIFTGGDWKSPPNNSQDLDWTGVQIDIPKHLKNQESEIINSLKEAFREYSTIGIINKDRKISVYFKDENLNKKYGDS